MNRSLLKQNAKRQLGGNVFSNNWLLAAVIALIVTILSGGGAGVISGLPGIRFGVTFNQNTFHPTDPGQFIEGFDPEQFFGGDSFVPVATFSVFFVLLFVFLMVFAVAFASFVSGPLQMGQNLAHLKLVRGRGPVEVGDVFGGFRNGYLNNVLLTFMRSLFIFLWSLLFIIPGIVKTYAWSMAFFVRLDHPDWNWKQCLDESDRLTKGHKGELFVLELSFLGWYIVGALCCGVGTYWVVAYHQCTLANAYEWLCALLYPAPAYAPQPESAAPEGYEPGPTCYNRPSPLWQTNEAPAPEAPAEPTVTEAPADPDVPEPPQE